MDSLITNFEYFKTNYPSESMVLLWIALTFGIMIIRGIMNVYKKTDSQNKVSGYSKRIPEEKQSWFDKYMDDFKILIEEPVQNENSEQAGNILSVGYERNGKWKIFQLADEVITIGSSYDCQILLPQSKDNRSVNAIVRQVDGKYILEPYGRIILTNETLSLSKNVTKPMPLDTRTRIKIDEQIIEFYPPK